MTVLISEATRRWCADRDHPFITYNPWLDRSYCRCGQRQEPGDQPQDWDATREMFHDCKPGEPCRCYASTKPDAGDRPRPVVRPEQESLFDEPTPPRHPARRPRLRDRPVTDVHLPT
ncbi:hypothetical protein OG900_33070 [Streptomyces sp. NBC_00433]